jgi:hypothetical protein
MPRYIISETAPCWITWTRRVEASSEAEAVALFDEGEGQRLNFPEIGDTLTGYDRIIDCEVEPVLATFPVFDP